MLLLLLSAGAAVRAAGADAPSCADCRAGGFASSAAPFPLFPPTSNLHF